MRRILAFDPGDTTGMYTFTEDGEDMYPPEFGQFTLDELSTLLLQYEHDVKTVVVEDYRIYSKRAIQQSGSRVKAAQAIGMIKMFAGQKGAEVVMQPANILPVAEKMAQVKMPGNHKQSHYISAYLHGCYYLYKSGLRKTPLQLEMESRNA